MAAVAERHETLVSEFERFRREPGFGPEPVRSGREAAFARFLERGFPTTRDEEWRFTNVAPIAAIPFVRASAATVDAAAIEPFLFSNVAAQIVLVNGRVSRDLSSLDSLPPGVSVETLPEGSHVNGRPSSGSFADLNDAFFEDVVQIRVAPKTILERPLHILAVTVPDGRAAMTLPRLSLQIGEAAEVSVVESYAGIGDGESLTSAVTTVDLDPGAVVNHVKLQRESDSTFHMANMTVRLNRASTFASRALTFGGRIARNDIMAVLEGEGAECTLNGLYVAGGESLVDTHTTIDHAMPHCPSHEVYKGILDGRAKAVFNGKIIVRQDAQKTDAKQTNKALLLTDNAQINTKPQLEIFADDVKCTHGAAIGQLDEDALFYLRARGISEIDARNLLIHAFAGEILDGVKLDQVRDRAVRLLEEKLRLPEQV